MFPVSRRAPFQWSGGEIWPRLNPNALYETLAISDSLGLTSEISAPLADTLGFADVVGVAWEISAAADTLVISDSAGAILSLHASAADTLSINDSVGSMQVASIADTLAIGDALRSTSYYPIVAADALAIADSSTTILFVSAYDTLAIADSAYAVLMLRATAADTLAISDFASDSATSSQHVMVMNLDTGAVSEYTLPAIITGMTQFDGVLYLATSNGLYALDAATDNGSDIFWRWQTGLTTLGIDQVKRPVDLNILGKIGAAVAEVITVEKGEKRIDYYAHSSENRDVHRDAVVKIGKGLSSVYWAFGEWGTDPAERQECRASMWVLSRRR